MIGTIAKLLLDKRFGFIEVAGEPDGIFFHEEALEPELRFDEQLQFMRVEFDCYHDDRTGKSKALRVRAAK